MSDQVTEVRSGGKRLSMRAAINAMCKACIYDPYAVGCGAWRQQVEACSSPNCPLYPLRPLSFAESDAEAAEIGADQSA